MWARTLLAQESAVLGVPSTLSLPLLSPSLSLPLPLPLPLPLEQELDGGPVRASLLGLPAFTFLHRGSRPYFRRPLNPHMGNEHVKYLAGAWVLGIDFCPAIHRTPRSSRLSWAFFLFFCAFLVGSTVLWSTMLLIHGPSSAAAQVSLLLAAVILRLATLASYIGTVRLMRGHTFTLAMRRLWRAPLARKWISRFAVAIPGVGFISLPFNVITTAQVQCAFPFAPQPRALCLAFSSVDYWAAFPALCAALLVIFVHVEALTLVVQQELEHAVSEVQQEWATPSHQLVGAALGDGVVLTASRQSPEPEAEGSGRERGSGSGAEAVAHVHHAYATCVATAEAISTPMLGLTLTIVGTSIATSFLVALAALYTSVFFNTQTPTVYLWGQVASSILFASVLGWRLVLASRRADFAIRRLSAASGLPVADVSALQQVSQRLPVAVRVGDLFVTHRVAQRVLAGALAGVAPLVLKRLVGPE